MGGPGISRFGLVKDRLSWDVRNIDQVIAAWTFDLPSRKLFITCQVLLAMGAFKLEFAHGGTLLHYLFESASRLFYGVRRRAQCLSIGLDPGLYQYFSIITGDFSGQQCCLSDQRVLSLAALAVTFEEAALSSER
jgi:hypothetical protein